MGCEHGAQRLGGHEVALGGGHLVEQYEQGAEEGGVVAGQQLNQQLGRGHLTLLQQRPVLVSHMTANHIWIRRAEIVILFLIIIIVIINCFI